MSECSKCNDHGIIRFKHEGQMAIVFCTCPRGAREKERSMDIQDAKEIDTKDVIDSFFDKSESILDWLGVPKLSDEEDYE